jgi:phage terminase small subunit
LTIKQRKFVNALADQGLSGREAAIKAGYSPDSAKRQAAKLMGLESIQTAIKERQTELAAESRTTVARIVHEYQRLALSNIQDLLNPDGTYIHPSEWPEDVARAVQSLEFNQDGGLWKVRLYSKQAALDSLAKYRGMLADRTLAVDVTIDKIERVILDDHTVPAEYTVLDGTTVEETKG